jgi:hypothetical protein
MLRTALFALLAESLQALPLQLDAQSVCTAKIESFVSEKPILTMPSSSREGVIGAVLPDLRAQANDFGYDLKDLQPTKLAHSLHYWPLSASTDERLWIVRFVTPTSCGPHDSCPSYVVGSHSKSIRNLLQGRDASFGTSAGGASGIAILPVGDRTHPELLFLSHISAYETAVGCFAWTDDRYRSAPCSPEYAHFLDTPRPH